ncbi:MAG: macro domain-containing protein [Rhizobiaceae bacterium]
MRIHLDGVTIQCLPGSLAAQASIDGLVVFVDTWLRPYGMQAEEVHNTGGQRLRSDCAEAGPLTLGKVATIGGYGLLADKLLNCIVASHDRPHPNCLLVYQCTLDALRQADELGLHSVAISPFGDFSEEAEGSLDLAILSAVGAMAGQARHLHLIRMCVPEDQPYDAVSMWIIREASRLRQEKGAA